MPWWFSRRGRHRRGPEHDDRRDAQQALGQAKEGLREDLDRLPNATRVADSLRERVERENHIGAAMIELFRSVRT